MINTHRYNLNDQDLIAACLEQLTTQGVCVLPDFLTLKAVEILRQQSEALAPCAFRSASRATPYLGPADETFPIGTSVIRSLKVQLKLLRMTNLLVMMVCAHSTNGTLYLIAFVNVLG